VHITHSKRKLPSAFVSALDALREVQYIVRSDLTFSKSRGARFVVREEASKQVRERTAGEKALTRGLLALRRN
jgi:hypothetical protein